MMKLEGLKIFKWPTVFNDERGEYLELYNSKLLKKEIPHFNVKQVSYVSPKKNSLRGFHGDNGTSKIISVLEGKFFIALVDPRPNSSTYMKSFYMVCRKMDNTIIYIPPGIGNGFLAMSNNCRYLYLQDTYYGEYEQFTISYKSLEYNIPWPKAKYIISERDKI